MRRKNIATIVVLSAAAIALSACASKPDMHIAYYGTAANTGALVSLGAGDSLGREIYVNDVVLAAIDQAAARDTAVADAPVDQD